MTTASRKAPPGLRALIIDMDGVLWRASEPLGDLPKNFARIQAQGWKFVLATNNSTRSPEQYFEKLRSFGVNGLEGWQIINSSQATAYYLHQQHPQGGPVYVIGEEGLVAALQEQGFYPAEEHVLAVVAGLDRSFTFEKMRQATFFIRRDGAPFIATNPDRTFPTPQGLEPGAGAVLAGITAATDVEPLIIGKPGDGMYRAALERMGAAPAETLVIGDRLETDIAGAQKMGCQTALLLSGVTDEAAARAWQPAPDWIAPDLTTLLERLI